MKKNIIFTSLILLTLTFGISTIYAEDLSPKIKVHTNIKESRDRNKEEIQKVREDFRENLKEKRASTTLIIKEKRENIVKAVQEKREIFRDEIMSLRKESKIQIDEKKAEFKDRLKTIKDENKKLKIENISNNISDLSIKFTANSTKIVDKLETVLLTIESRTDKASLSGLGVDNVRSLIVSADTAIADARVALTNQIGKVYTVAAVDEATIKSSLQSNRDLLKKDIKIVNDKIKAAHEAIKKANNALRVIPGINNSSSTINTN
jgi:hypothetical protein